MIVSILRSCMISLGIACVAFFVLSGLRSDYIFAFLRENIINIQIGLLAINTATLGVVLTKLRDLVDRGVPLAAFTKTRSEMLLSVREQMALVVSALIILSLADARGLPFSVPSNLLKILLLGCFAYSLMILYDTAKSVFVVLGEQPGD